MKNFTKVFIAFTFLMSLTYVAKPQSATLIAWYPFNGNTFDYSGHNNNATNYSATYTTDRFGNLYGAAHFNGSAYVQCPDDFDFPQRTICAWVKAETFPAAGAVIYSSDHNGLQYGLTKLMVAEISGANNLFMGVSANIYYNDKLSPETWVHAAMSISTDYIRFFVDGVLMDSLVNDDLGHSTDGSTYARIGVNRILQRYFTGDIDDVQIYSGALTAIEINNIYASSKMEDAAFSEFRVYPSPANDHITIGLGNNQYTDKSLGIYDISGRLMRNISMEENTAEINISDLTEGTYIIRLQCNKGIACRNFIKM